MEELTGVVRDWMMNTSFSRTLSFIFTKMFSLENSETCKLPRCTPNCREIASASGTLARPLKRVRFSRWDMGDIILGLLATGYWLLKWMKHAAPTGGERCARLLVRRSACCGQSPRRAALLR